MMKISLVIMAAGIGSRFGGKKLLTKICGKPLFTYSIDLYDRIDFNKKIIVTAEKEIENYIEGKKFIHIKNSHPELGQSHTIKLAVNECLKDDAIMFSVCDQPLITQETVSSMIKIYEPSTILVTRNKERFGNPNIFDKKFFNELLELKDDEGGKKVIKNNMEYLKYFDVKNDYEFIDVDIKDDIKHIEQCFRCNINKTMI